MRILIAVHHFPPHHIGGAELCAYRTALWLRKHGHEATVICVEHVDRGRADGVVWTDDVYKGVPVRRLLFDVSKAMDWPRRECDNPWVEKHVRDHLLELRPAVFHLISGYLMGAGSVRAAKGLGIPVVITLTDFWFFCPRVSLLRPDGELCTSDRFDALACTRCRFEEKRRYRLAARIAPGAADWFWTHVPESGWGRLLHLSHTVDAFGERNHTLMRALSSADALVCPAQILIDELSATGTGFRRVFFNGHGIDSSAWLPVSAIEEPDGVIRIGYIGQISPHKGVHLLVNAFCQLRSESPLELVIYGNEQAFPDFTRHLRRTAHGDERVKILGGYAYQQVARILAQIDVLVVPSTCYEIGPFVMYEAFETKTPVVASDLPNMNSEIRRGENGLLFRSGDVEDLARHLQSLVDQPVHLEILRRGIRPPKTMEQEMTELMQTYRLLGEAH